MKSTMNDRITHAASLIIGQTMVLIHIREARKLFGKKFTIILKDAKASAVETGSSYVEGFLKLMG